MPSAIEELWRHFNAVRRQAGDPKASKIVKEAAERLGVGLPEATVRGWIKQATRGTQGGVPRSEDQFIVVITVLRLLAVTPTRNPGNGRAPTTLSVQEKGAWLSRLRAAKAEEDGLGPAPKDNQPHADSHEQEHQAVDEEDAPPPDDPQPASPRPRRRPSPTIRWIAAGVAVTLIVAGGLILRMINNDEAPAVRYERGRFPTSPGPLPNAGPIVACPPPTTNKPDSVAESTDGAARAEYYRKNNLFLVYDNKPEGHSAVLQLTIPGVSQTDWYNTRGHTCNGRDHPLAMVVDQIEPNQVMVFRVCIGEWEKHGRMPPESCGNTSQI